jgi:hypothetical protein
MVGLVEQQAVGILSLVQQVALVVRQHTLTVALQQVAVAVRVHQKVQVALVGLPLAHMVASLLAEAGLLVGLRAATPQRLQIAWLVVVA